MQVHNRETYWSLQTFEISKRAAIGGFVNRGLSSVNAIQRRLLDDPGGNFSSDLSYSADRPTSPM